jgi:DNA primase
MPAGALRMQLLNELAEVARSAPAEVESLFGIKPWRRLPDTPRTANRRQAAETADLKQHILQRLLAFPDLASEFDGAIAVEFAEGESPVDRQVVEVWRTASGTAGLTCGSLQELLAESDFAPQYREAATRELMAETDPDAARLELAGAFAKLELRRLNSELEVLAGQQPLDAAALAKIRELSERRARLMAGADAEGRGGKIEP